MRTTLRSTHLGPALAVAFAMFATACAEVPSAPLTLDLARATADNILTTTTVGSGELDDATNWYYRVWVCKVGTDATIEVRVNGGTAVAHSFVANECTAVHLQTNTDPAHIDTVQVTEIPSSLFVLDSIAIDSTALTKIRLPLVTSANTVTVYTQKSKGAIVTFYNRPEEPPPSGGEGCTPGYWKQSQHFDSWTAPYAPTSMFSDVFANAFPGQTLLQVLQLGGGGLNALGRHAVAALLNTASAGVAYDLTTAGVIAAFNDAFASGDYETQKNIFARFNELGCPLN